MAVVTEEMEDIFASKMSWKEREALILEAFPSVERLAWERALEADPALFGETIRGILKYDQVRTGKPGPRPTASREASEQRLLQFMGEDYSIEPFPEALRALKGDLSIRGLTAKTGVNYNTIFALLHGRTRPDVLTMTQIAAAFNKHPSYFLEYRIHFLVAALCAKMQEWPESSIVAYRKFKEEG